MNWTTVALDRIIYHMFQIALLVKHLRIRCAVFIHIACSSTRYQVVCLSCENVFVSREFTFLWLVYFTLSLTIAQLKKKKEVVESVV